MPSLDVIFLLTVLKQDSYVSCGRGLKKDSEDYINDTSLGLPNTPNASGATGTVALTTARSSC